MKYLLRHIIVVFLLIALVSCDVASGLLTTNHFEQFKDINPFSLVVNEDSFGDLDQEEKVKIIDEYTAVALSKDDSADLFKSLKALPGYRDAITAFYRSDVVAVIPDTDSETYSEDLIQYQRHQMALGKIEVLSREATGLEGFRTLYINYFSGELTEPLTQELFITKVFMVEELREDGDSDTDIKANLVSDLKGAYFAGKAFNELGSSILNTDNPTSSVITEGDGVTILISNMIYRIAQLSNPSFDYDNFADDIMNNSGSFTTGTIFPTGKGDKDTELQNYLGEGGALSYAATGYSLPDITVLKGGTK